MKQKTRRKNRNKNRQGEVREQKKVPEEGKCWMGNG